MPVAVTCVVTVALVPVPPPFLYSDATDGYTGGAPLLVVTDVGARLVRRGLLSPGAAAAGWVPARVLVFRRGPVVWERPPGAASVHARCDLFPARAR
jgi:pectin methylesterase-like acyl-CoA thioesterase